MVGIHLAPQASEYTGRIYSYEPSSCQRVPPYLERVPGLVLVRGGVSRVPGAAALAAGFRLPGVRRHGDALTRQSGTFAVQELRPPKHCDRGHDLRQDPHPIEGLAGCRLVRDQSEAGGQRPGSAAGSRIGQLPDRLDYVAPISSGDGAARPRATQGRGRGRRDLLGDRLSQTNRCCGTRQRQEPQGAHRRGRRDARAQGFRTDSPAPYRQGSPPSTSFPSCWPVSNPVPKFEPMARRPTVHCRRWDTPTNARSSSARMLHPTCRWPACTGFLH